MIDMSNPIPIIVFGLILLGCFCLVKLQGKQTPPKKMNKVERFFLLVVVGVAIVILMIFVYTLVSHRPISAPFSF